MTKSESQTDEEIAERVQEKDKKAFKLLVERYKDKIMRYGKKFLFNYNDIEDLVQKVFIKAYINIKSFDTSKKFSPWIYRIAHNEFVNAIKKKDKEPLPFFDLDTFFPHPFSQEKIENDMDHKQFKEVMNKCLNKLEPKYREILILYYFEQMDYKEISKILRVPIGTVGVRLGRARKNLKNSCPDLDYSSNSLSKEQ